MNAVMYLTSRRCIILRAIDESARCADAASVQSLAESLGATSLHGTVRSVKEYCAFVEVQLKGLRSPQRFARSFIHFRVTTDLVAADPEYFANKLPNYRPEASRGVCCLRSSPTIKCVPCLASADSVC